MNPSSPAHHDIRLHTYRMKKGNFGNRVECGRYPLSFSLSVSLLVFLSRSCELLGYTGQFLS